MRGFVSLLLVAGLLAIACNGGGEGNGNANPTAPAGESSATAPPSAQPSATVAAAPTPTPFDPNSVTLRAERVGSGFDQPIQVTHAGDGSNRVFVVEKPGRIRLLDGALFLDITDRVLTSPIISYEREQGMHSVAFHPQFRSSGYFFVHYIDLTSFHVVSRFRIGANNLGDPRSEKILIRYEQPDVNFVGGSIAFGPDGYLYLAFGTGGVAKELQDNAQNLGNLYGKMLRIDVDRGDPYGIPADNPFVNRAGARPEIWAYGLRNPWRFSWDRARGDLYIGGPGEFKREWINFLPAGSPAGANFAWPIYEGTLCRLTSCSTSGLSMPIIEMNSYENGNCVILGGHVYRGRAYPMLQGAYFYGDFCSSRIWTAGRDRSGKWASREMLTLSGSLLSSFGEDEAGEVYAVDIYQGGIYRFAASSR